MKTRLNKTCLAILVTAVSASFAWAGGWSATYSLATGTVSLTNTQENTSWAPVAVLWKFDAATNAAVAVERVSQSNTFLLGVASVTGATSTVWIPETYYPFDLGDVLRVTSSVTNGQVQVIRKGE